MLRWIAFTREESEKHGERYVEKRRKRYYSRRGDEDISRGEEVRSKEESIKDRKRYCIRSW